MLNLHRFLLFVFISSLVSCDNSSPPTAAGCSIEEQNQFVHEVLLDRYLWYQQIDTSINYADFDSPQQTLDYLRYDQFDPPNGFSYIADASDFDSLYNSGQYEGYGFSFLIENDNTVWIRFTYDDSPAGNAGLTRGDEILEINGETVADLITSGDMNGIFSPGGLGYPLDLRIQNQSGVSDLHLEKDVVNINTVLHHSMLSNGSEQVGYLVYKSFLNTSNDEFEPVFENFNNAGIDKLILDLRYNGGGSVSVARNLGSYLNSDHASDDIFGRLNFNDKNQSSNTTYYFRSLLNALDLQQVVVIATGATCSASEMIINGLKPFVDVKVVGSTTCGKPVGMNGFEFCENVLLPVTFANSNHNNEGDYYSGLPVDCAATDDINFQLGNSTEPMLAEALYVSENNTCQTVSKAEHKSIQPPAYSPASLRAIIGAF